MIWSIDESGVQVRPSRVMRAETGSPRTSAPRPLTPRTMSRSEMIPAIRPSAAVPHPSVDSRPEPGVPRPRNHPQEAARRPERALQPHTRALRNLRPGPALHRNALQGIRMDQCRNHKGTERDDRYNKYDKPKKGHLALPASGKTGKEPSTSEIRPSPPNFSLPRPLRRPAFPALPRAASPFIVRR